MRFHITEKLKMYFEDPLYRNSFFIILSSIASAGFGFLFWILAARLYSNEDVGIATALISSISLIILLTQFGLDQSIVRFFPNGDRSKIFGTSFIITAFFSLVFGVIFIAGINIWTPELRIIQRYTVIYLLFLLANCLVSLSGISFIAVRGGGYFFFQSMLIGLRVMILFPLVFLGAFGIFSSFGTSLVIAAIFSIIILTKFRIGLAGIDRTYLYKAFHFSAGTYLAGLLNAAPSLTLPLMVLNILGPEQTAHYYIAFSIASLLSVIPAAFSTSLFVEGSYGAPLRKAAMKSLLAIYSLLLPAIVVLYFYGSFVLGIVGKGYLQGFDLLKLMAISCLFSTLSTVYFSIKKVQKDMRSLIFFNALVFGLIISLSYIFLTKIGITGVGYAFIGAYGTSSLIICIVVMRQREV